MASITSVSGDTRLRLGNEEFMRRMAFGNNWKKLVVSFRATVADQPGNIVGGNLAVGVSSGTAAGFLSASTTDFFGVQYNSASYNYNRNVGYYSNPTNNNNQQTIRKVGASIVASSFSTNAGTAGALNSTIGPGPGPVVLILVRDLSATTITAQIFYGNQSTVTRYQSIQNAEEANIGTQAPATGMAAVACGPLYDTLSISWASASPYFEISDITTARIE